MRQILFSKEFDLAVDMIGGYRFVDSALEPVIEGLVLNPYGFSKFENDLVSFRYARTKPFGSIPALVFYFQILSNKDVELTYVELYEEY